MEFFDSISRGIAEHPTAALLTLALLAIGWLVRDSRSRELGHTEKITALYEAHLKAMQEANAAHLQTAMQVVPVAGKLISCIEILERMTVGRGVHL